MSLASRKMKIQSMVSCRALVAHACSPSYSGGKDQENHSLKPAETPTENRAGGVAQVVERLPSKRKALS
jgi:hypothetical protein